MTNAKEEFLEHIEDKGKIICAKIGVEKYIEYFYEEKILKDNYTKKEYDDFLDSLNFTYDAGFGGQILFGKILFENSYSDRGEYDGSEWWDNHKMPSIEEVLSYNNNLQ